MNESKTDKVLSIIEKIAPIVGIGILGFLAYKILGPILNFGSETVDNIRNIAKPGPAYETATPINTSAYGFTNDDFLNWIDKPIYAKTGASAIRKTAKSSAPVISYPNRGDQIGNFYSVALEMLPQSDGTKKGKVWVVITNGANGQQIGYIPLLDVSLSNSLNGATIFIN